MRRGLQLLRAMLITLGVSGFMALPRLEAQVLAESWYEHVYKRISAAGNPPKIRVGDEHLQAAVMLVRFYEQRAYQLAWSDNKEPRPDVDTLIKALYEADREGLRPEDYHLEQMETLLREMRQSQEQQNLIEPKKLVDWDFLLTDAFLLYVSHAWAGRIDPKTVDAEAPRTSGARERFCGPAAKRFGDRSYRRILTQSLPIPSRL